MTAKDPKQSSVAGSFLDTQFDSGRGAVRVGRHRAHSRHFR